MDGGALATAALTNKRHFLACNEFGVERVMQVGTSTKNPKVVRYPCRRMVSLQDTSQSSHLNGHGGACPKKLPSTKAPTILPTFGDEEVEFIENHLLWAAGIAEADPPELNALHILQALRSFVIFKASKLSGLDVVATGGLNTGGIYMDG